MVSIKLTTIKRLEFIKDYKIMMNEKESEQLEELIKEVISGRLDSVHIHNFVQRLITEAVGNAIEEHLDN